MISPVVLDDVVRRALAEDLLGGDLTTEATVAADSRAVGRAIAKQELVVCGGAVFTAVFRAIDGALRVVELTPDGAVAAPGTVLWEVEGPTRSVLQGERTALNFVQRMSGVATLARRWVAALPAGAATRVTDTRKTTPGLRALERYAVRCGGAFNHRDSLGAGVLIKDNHIEAAGGVGAAVRRARAHAPHTVKIEVEVESLAQLDEALAADADVVMLDNFAPNELEEAVRRCRRARVAGPPVLVEVSGGVTLDRLARLAELGVDVVSVGALTHSAPSSDISLDIERLESEP